MTTERITIEQLLTHVAHGCKIQFNDSKGIWDIGFGEDIKWDDNIYPLSTLIYCVETQNINPISFKLLLRPLSSLTKPITHNGETFVPIDIFLQLYGGGLPESAKHNWKQEFADNILYSPIEAISFGIVQKLLEWHFDIFGLHEKGLCVLLEK